MGKRRKAREIVLQSLYEAEFSDRSREEILEGQVVRRSSTDETTEYARRLLDAVLDHVEELDQQIKSALKHWDLERLSLVDKNILRFALAELLFFDEVPTKVIMNEAIDIAHKYSSNDAGKFVNGVLDRFAREYRKDVV